MFVQDFTLLVLGGIWLAGTWIRIYRQARFYQIEEYMSRRYLRWFFADKQGIAPVRPIGAWFIGMAIGFLLGEAPDSILAPVIGIVSAVIAIVPVDEGEIKKKFVRTQRVSRMMGTAFVVSTLFMGLVLVITTSFKLPDIVIIRVAVVSGIGLLNLLLTPLWLVLGNILMTPVEAYFRQRFLKQAQAIIQTIHPKIIGITGSYGKTTTKHFLRDILSARYRTYATPKSYNTLMGVTLAINRDLADDFSIEYFISEMGAYVPGEIERICGLTPPDISIVTEVGPQHLERFGSLENIKIAKYEIIKNLPADGVGVFNWDNPYIQEMVKLGYPSTRITVSKALTLAEAENQRVNWLASDIHESLDGMRFKVHRIDSGEEEVFVTSVVGEHNVTNLLLAIAVAYHEGLSLREIAMRVRSLQAAESRLVQQTTGTGITIINDAYSANPVGVKSALKVLGMHDTGKRLLITPGMIELGDLQWDENRKLGELATQYASDIILIGKLQTQAIYEGIRATSFDLSRVQVMETLGEAVQWYQSQLSTGDTVLFLNDLPDTY